MLLVGAVANMRSQFQQDILDRDIGQFGDVVSFHHYGIDAVDRSEDIRKMKAQTSREGKPVEVWHSEGAGTIDIASWLHESGYPGLEPEGAARLCAITATQMIAYKAMGVKRYFHYPSPTNGPQGRFVFRNDFAYGSDVSGLPLPLWSSYAACVAMLEGARPVGLTKLEVNGRTVWRAQFKKHGKEIDVVWGLPGSVLADLPGFEPRQRQVFDMFGNRMLQESKTPIGREPIYVK
jgi:hypothetical protein